jgi:hypothetical protein
MRHSVAHRIEHGKQIPARTGPNGNLAATSGQTHVDMSNSDHS